MDRCRQLEYIRLLEEKLKGASPGECGRLTKELVKMKDRWING